MEEYQFILENINEIYNNENIISIYKDNFMKIIRNIDSDLLHSSMNEDTNNYLVLASMYVGSLFVKRDFKGICDVVSVMDLTGTDRKMDYFVAKVLKYYYPSLKYTGGSMVVLYRLYATNREYRNVESVGILTNCLLDYQINICVYQHIVNIGKMSGSNENARYFLYHGIIHMVDGEYNEAMECFTKADILQKKRSLEMLIRKHTIICKLLAGDFLINYRYVAELEPYFALAGCVKRAELSVFHETLEKHKAEYFQLNLWFVVRRLVKNLLREGVRKISMCYLRIPVAEISRILGTDARVLLQESLHNKFIDGFVRDDIYYGGSRVSGKERSYGEKIRELVSVENEIGGMMRYPEIVPLTYENQ